MRALVTGGAGFIGSHLVEALVARGHRVKVLDNLSMGRRENLRSVWSRIQFLRGDVRDPKMLKEAVRGVGVVFHQAALRSVPKSVGDPAQYHEVNTTATLLLLGSALAAGVRRLLFASSSSIYGLTPLPQREDMPVFPQSPYAASKLAGEVYCRMFTRLHGLETVCLRYFNVFGPRQSLENEYAVVVPKFITSLLKGQSPPIHGNGLQTRDFTYVENVVQANLLAARAPRAAGEVFNVASGRRMGVRELFEVVRKKVGVQVAPRVTPPRPGDVRDTWADIQRARRILGYRVTVSVKEGLSRTVDWFDRNREAWAD